ncbi:MAG: metalloregulator ArsR/SmtB family transcription factor [Candidatus Omnitrophica bacterium]|nr:metalloregulator ArsR/SmtB family transcription factor [Candidatus Omnitrophota bacterium]
MVKIFKALADKTRQDIVGLLAEEEMNVTDICSEFNITQPTVSHHLHILKNCDLVDTRKDGKNVYYCLRQEIVDEAFGRIVKKMHIKIVRKKKR